ncbi:MAG: adenylyl-sulfate kinase, partial [Gracilimonas sp.]
KAKKGEIKGLTGFDANHEVPKNPELRIDTDSLSVEEAVEKILGLID